ncbi:MAG: YfhO family protein, partial [Blautia sp.]|nr:YfhO family protein [Blautia sp.]
GFYRIEQNGNVKTDFANLNRIWSADQYISSIYSSVENTNYQNFRTQTFQVEQPYRNILMQARAHNAVFQRFMGVKYLVSDETVPGYKKIGEKLYENENVLPVAYYTSSVMPEAQYDALQFPYNQLAFLSRAVVDEKGVGNTETAFLDAGLKKIPVNIQADAIGIEKASEGDILFLQFQVENHLLKSDVAISVEGVRNKLTAEDHIYYNGNTCFTYAVLLKEGQTSVAVSLGDGDYEISDLTGYLWKSAANKELRSQLVEAEFILDKDATKGDVIKGSVDATADSGYLITSIPYDENFEVFVDGERTAYEKVNAAFLGLKMDKGKHEVTIAYHAPGVLAGKILSVLGLILGVLAHFVIFRKRSSKESK